MSVTLTAAMRANLLSLQSTATLMGATQFKLATGNKVNSALDNPSSFFAAQGLNNRAGDLSSLLDGMGQAVQTLKAADEGIKGLTTLLEQAKAVAQTAKTASLGANTVTGTGTVAPGDAADIGGNLGTIADNDEISLYVGGTGVAGTGTNIQVAVTAAMTLGGFVDAINAADSRLHAEMVADPANTGNFFLKISTNDGSSLEIAANGTNSAAVNTGFGFTAGVVAAAPDTATQVTQYNDLRTQIDQFIDDTGYRGINLLNGGTLVTQFNEGNTSTQTVAGVTRDSATMGIAAADFSGTSAIDDSIDDIDAALATLRNDASTFGNALSIIQSRQDFTTNLINVLKDGATSLTIADKNEEGANMLALQTSQQLGIQALSLASQANQSVLRLFS